MDTCWNDDSDHVGERCIVIKDGVVCDCDCTPCKRAWWRQGRPINAKGAIVYAPGPQCCAYHRCGGGQDRCGNDGYVGDK